IVHELQGKTLFDCSWLHSLKSWSLLKTRGDSCCVLHSVVNLAAFALYEKGELKRCFAASGDDGVFASTGKVLSAERKVTSQYAEISNGDGEIVYVDDDGETFTLDALGEDIVFEIVSMMTGKRPDRDEELFSAPADIYSKPPVLRALFRW
ncbi:DUF6928 family protein, partial [Nitrosomonas europaea]|uniref:DUF6928 family protein n=2 Tax=Nitrosomonas TaxID=914 RepID=UPI00089C04B3